MNGLHEAALRSHLKWTQALESSLNRSLRALIDLNLESLRSATAEQILLAQEMAAMLEGGHEAQNNPQPAGDEPQVLVPAVELPGELRSMQRRIYEALRLQSAVLVRSQRKQSVLANMLAGVGVPYGPLPVRRYTPQADS
jgi:hypothetical protein